MNDQVPDPIQRDVKVQINTWISWLTDWLTVLNLTVIPVNFIIVKKDLSFQFLSLFLSFSLHTLSSLSFPFSRDQIIRRKVSNFHSLKSGLEINEWIIKRSYSFIFSDHQTSKVVERGEKGVWKERKAWNIMIKHENLEGMKRGRKKVENMFHSLKSLLHVKGEK